MLRPLSDTPGMSIDDVYAVHQAFLRAQELVETARRERNEAIARALAQGISQADITRATGLTRGRISQIVAEARS